MAASTTPSASHEHLVLQGLDVDTNIVSDFWANFVPNLPSELNTDWTHARRESDVLVEKFGSEKLYTLERIAHRYACLLFARLAPSFRESGLGSVFGFGTTSVPVPSMYHLRLLCLHITTQSKNVYEEVWADPDAASAYAESLTMASGHRLMVLCNYEMVAYQARKLRLLEHSFKHSGRPDPTKQQALAKAKLESLGVRLWGALEAVTFMKSQLASDDESWPTYTITKTTEVKRNSNT